MRARIRALVAPFTGCGVARTAHVPRLLPALVVLVLVAGCYDVHGAGDADARTVDTAPFDAGFDAPLGRDGGGDAPDAGLDAPPPDDDASIEPCAAQVGVCHHVIGLGARLALPFGNRPFATVQDDRLVQLVYRGLGAGFDVVSVSADLSEIRTETEVPPSALHQDGVDFELLSHLGPADSRCSPWLAEFVTHWFSTRAPFRQRRFVVGVRSRTARAPSPPAPRTMADCSR